MSCFALVVVGLALTGAAVLCGKLYGGQIAPVSCIRCGKCIAAGGVCPCRGEKMRKNDGSYLTNLTKKI